MVKEWIENKIATLLQDVEADERSDQDKERLIVNIFAGNNTVYQNYSINQSNNDDEGA